MPVLNVPRAGRKNKDYAKKLITSLWNDERKIYSNSYGVCDMNPETVLYSFDAVNNVYQKINKVKVHYMEIFIEYELGLATARLLLESMGHYFYSEGFQSYGIVMYTGNTYMIACVVNAVSYDGRKVFHDNNAHYQEIYRFLQERIPTGWSLSVTENTFFDPRIGEGNYIHGMHV